MFGESKKPLFSKTKFHHYHHSLSYSPKIQKNLALFTFLGFFRRSTCLVRRLPTYIYITTKLVVHVLSSLSISRQVFFELIHHRFHVVVVQQPVSFCFHGRTLVEEITIDSSGLFVLSITWEVSREPTLPQLLPNEPEAPRRADIRL